MVGIEELSTPQGRVLPRSCLGCWHNGFNYLFVRYEDLIDSPRTWLAKIVQFAGESLDQENPIDGSGIMNPQEDHTAGGNPSRYRHSAIALRPDDEWRQKLPEAQKHLVTALTAPLLHKYGYSTSLQETLQHEAAVDSCAALTENERSLG